MPVTVTHAYSATTPDLPSTDPFYGEVRSSQWNDAHAVTMSALSGSEIFGAFGTNDTSFNVTFSTNTAGQVVASAAGGGGAITVTGANGSSVVASTLAFSNSNGITLGVSTAASGATVTGSYTQSNQRVSATNGQADFQTLAFVDSQGVSFSLSNGGAGVISVFGSHNGLTSQSNQQVSGSNGNANFQTLKFVNSNGVSFGLSDGGAGAVTLTASYTVPTITSWTVSDNATSATVGRLAFTQSNGITMSLSTSNNGNHTVIASHNGLTSQSGQAFSASGGSSAFQTLSFTNSNGFTFSNTNGSVVGSYTVPTVTDYFSKTNTTFNGANISGSITHNTAGLQLSLSVAAPGAAAEANAINLLGANTAGNTTATGSTIGWSGVNATLSGTNNSQVVISVPATSSLVGTSGMSISSNGSTISVQPVPMSSWDNLWEATQAGTAQANSLVSIQPLYIEHLLAASNVLVAGSVNVASAANNSSGYFDASVSGVIYTANASTLSSLFSFSNSYTVSFSSNATGTVTGVQGMTATFAGTTLTPGQYYLALHVSTANSATGGANTTALANTVSMILGRAPGSAAQLMKFIGNQSNASIGLIPGLGIISTGATRASIAFSDYTVTGTRAALAGVGVALRNSTWQ